MAQTTALVEALKLKLREQRLTYSDVADHLGISVASVKRLFADKQFSLKRFDAVCELAGIEITELAQSIEQQKLKQLTLEQETELVSDIKLLLVAVSALNRWSFSEIVDAYEISETELITYLAKLDRMKIVELLPGNRIRPLTNKDFQWLRQGPIQRFFEAEVQNDFFHCQFDKPGEIRLFLTGMLTPGSNEKMHKKLNRLAADFKSLDREDEPLNLEQRVGTSLVLAMRPWEMKQFAQLRRGKKAK